MPIKKKTTSSKNPTGIIMSKSPKVVQKSELAVNAFGIMEKNKITSVVVMDGGKYVGLIHIHDVLREGIV